MDIGVGMASPKVAVTARVLVGSKVIFNAGKMHDESATVQSVIDTALAKAAAHSERSLIFASAEAFQEDAMERRGTILDAADLSDMHVSDLRNQFGRCFLKVHAQFNEAEAGTPQVASVVDALPVPVKSVDLLLFGLIYGVDEAWKQVLLALPEAGTL